MHQRVAFGMLWNWSCLTRTSTKELCDQVTSTIKYNLQTHLYFPDHLINLKEASIRLRENGLKPKPKNCKLF